jgi:mono/diheme cytochrome c family protein
MTCIVRRFLVRSLGFLTLLAAFAAIAAACSAPGSTDLNSSKEPVDLDKGRQVFQQTCRACHALADAQAAGVFGPDLDLLQPDANRVREEIDSGGGGMPAHLLTGADADLVARYVAKVAGANPDAEGAGNTRGTTKPRTTESTNPTG